jgi:hypothetical protein
MSVSPLKKPKKQPKNLNELIEDLPSPSISNDGIRELLLKFITEIGEDKEDGVGAPKTKAKLEAFGLLVKLNQLEQKQSGTADLVSIIEEGEGEDE